FDTAGRAAAGRYSFRFWVDDTTPPSVRLVSSRARPGGSLTLLLRDAGSGVDPASLSAMVDGSPRSVRYAGGRAVVSLGDPAPGPHAFVFRVSDRQEAKNMENGGPVLPNTP